MNASRLNLLKDLERFGAENDRRATERRDRMLNIAPDTGNLLSLLVKSAKPREILEIGTSNGYSTVWLADAAEAHGGRVTSVETSAVKAAMARENFARAALTETIDLRVADGGEFLRAQSRGAFEWLFLDADRSQYCSWWPDVNRVLARGGLLVVDNALSHPDELGPFIELVRDAPAYQTAVIPIGKGEFIALKELGGA
jgi:predicted O-methyltransferase YrrM